MGEASYVLGVKIVRDRFKKLLCLSQETYIKKLLERYQMRNCKPIETPVEKNVGLSLDMGPKTPEEREKMSRVPSSSAVKSLLTSFRLLSKPDPSSADLSKPCLFPPAESSET